MTPQETNNLRLEVKQILAGIDMDRYGCRAKHIEALKEKGIVVSLSTLCMALTGRRTTAPYAAILQALKDIYSNGEFIHGVETKNN